MKKPITLALIALATIGLAFSQCSTGTLILVQPFDNTIGLTDDCTTAITLNCYQKWIITVTDHAGTLTNTFSMAVPPGVATGTRSFTFDMPLSAGGVPFPNGALVNFSVVTVALGADATKVLTSDPITAMAQCQNGPPPPPPPQGKVPAPSSLSVTLK